jgi:hypothetical protein
MSDDQDTSHQHDGAGASGEENSITRGGAGHGFGISSETLEAANRVMGRLARRTTQPMPLDGDGH